MDKNVKNAIKNIGHMVDLWLPAKIKYDKIPGLSIGIVYKGELLYSSGFGFSDLSKKKKVDEKTLYHIASISKTFTSVAIMQLVDAGKVRLDDKVADYVDWFEGKNKEKDSKNITIRQVLSHTAGLFRDGDTPHWETGKFPSDLRKSFSPESLILENATGFKYSNYAFSLLGLVIEKVSGFSYDEYIEKNILKPLKMTSTATDYKKDLRNNVATGYGREIPDEERRVFDHYKTNAYAPATGFLSNVSDLAKYLGALTLDSKSEILSREAKKEMFRPHEKTVKGNEYGLGFHVIWEDNKKIVGHGGGFNGFITQVWVDPESGIGVVALSNTLEGSAPAITTGILKAVFDEMGNSSNLTGKIPSFKKYEGLYRNVWGDTVIAQLGRKLLAFDVGVNWPLKFATILEPIKNKKDSFVMNDKNVFDARNEIAAFNKFTSGHATIFNSGPTPSKRVKLKK